MKTTKPTEEKSPFSQKLRSLRRQNDISQSELSKALGVPLPTYSNWEQGRAVPTIHMLPQIAAYYHITIDDLMGVTPGDVEERIIQRMGSMTADQKEKLAALLESMFPGESRHTLLKKS